MEIAVIWIPADIEPSEPAVAKCLRHLRRHSYRFAGTVRAPWETVEQSMIDGEVDVVVIADFAHLPPDRSPRIELASATGDDADGDQPAPDTQQH
ncbi:hypothetical protein KBX53_03345 [Micromonospora sp. M51]|uniref:Uncharacterized protein n=1 Tax=Micromonospora parva TaxID=1464048 RepID=A0ABW6VNP3_9ACTN|nr:MULTISPECIES: hypothetical protein [Micromonospora]MBQ1009999.1 hypothetical protein [Micromonospora sp. M51]MBQ1028675.1 hypothetical protein [Micromonospora sp. C97]